MNKSNSSVLSLPIWLTYLFILLCAILTNCKKSHSNDKDNVVNFAPRLIHYKITGTHFKLAFIDSNSVFQSEQTYTGSFDYQFRKGPGAGIGFSVNVVDSIDTIQLWEIYIDNKLYANAFSQGGAYFDIPYP